MSSNNNSPNFNSVIFKEREREEKRERQAYKQRMFDEYTLSKCPGRDQILHGGLKLNSKN